MQQLLSERQTAHVSAVTWPWRFEAGRGWGGEQSRLLWNLARYEIFLATREIRINHANTSVPWRLPAIRPAHQPHTPSREYSGHTPSLSFAYAGRRCAGVLTLDAVAAQAAARSMTSVTARAIGVDVDAGITPGIAAQSHSDTCAAESDPLASV